MQKLTKFKVIFDLFLVCVYFIQQQNCKLSLSRDKNGGVVFLFRGEKKNKNVTL